MPKVACCRPSPRVPRRRPAHGARQIGTVGPVSVDVHAAEPERGSVGHEHVGGVDIGRGVNDERRRVEASVECDGRAEEVGD